MTSLDPLDAREAEIAKIAESQKDRATLQQHLNEIVEGTAFKGSHRSGQFLRYIVDQALAGHFESLKERVIGMELFGRVPSYDTGEDAIVRVTASDVRKRLLQHYGKYGASSEFRISLPLGSYIPEINRDGNIGQLASIRAQQELAVTPQDLVAEQRDSATLQADPVVISLPVPNLETFPTKTHRRSQWLLFGILFATLNLALWGIFWFWSSRAKVAPAPILPWSAIFNSSHATHLIASDPSIAEVQEIAGNQISVSDYANHNYIPHPNRLTPEENRLCRTVLIGNKAASVDMPVAVDIAELAQAGSIKMDVHAARDIGLPNLETNDNFVFLGSPRSDPWFSLFSDQLDFRFAFDESSKLEFIRNVHPRPNEQSTYVPTARGWATGDSFAIIALVRNPDQDGQVLLLAGASAEGTAAAGKLVTDLPHFSLILRRCGIDPSGPLQHFELLLHLNTMAGSPNNIEVVGCHILPGAPVQKP